jgi:hypothetical protein
LAPPSAAQRTRRRKAPAQASTNLLTEAGPASAPEPQQAARAVPARKRKDAAAAPKAKAASIPAAVAAVPPQTAGKHSKAKARLVRDSFTMPQADYDLIGTLKTRAVASRRPTKKSELLRAGLHALQALDDAGLYAALEALMPIKAGRPRKGG